MCNVYPTTQFIMEPPNNYLQSAHQVSHNDNKLKANIFYSQTAPQLPLHSYAQVGIASPNLYYAGVGTVTSLDKIPFY